MADFPRCLLFHTFDIFIFLFLKLSRMILLTKSSSSNDIIFTVKSLSVTSTEKESFSPFTHISASVSVSRFAYVSLEELEVLLLFSSVDYYLLPKAL